MALLQKELGKQWVKRQLFFERPVNAKRHLAVDLAVVVVVEVASVEVVGPPEVEAEVTSVEEEEGIDLEVVPLASTGHVDRRHLLLESQCVLCSSRYYRELFSWTRKGKSRNYSFISSSFGR